MPRLPQKLPPQQRTAPSSTIAQVVWWLANRSTAVEKAMQLRSPRQVVLTRPVPVHVIYATAVARESGAVDFYDDIYDLDTALARQLRRGYPYQRLMPDAVQLASTNGGCGSPILSDTGER